MNTLLHPNMEKHSEIASGLVSEIVILEISKEMKDQRLQNLFDASFLHPPPGGFIACDISPN